MNTKDLIKCAIFASIMAILSQISIPIPFASVPITMQVFGVLLCGIILKSKLAFLSQIIYLLIGSIGIPVFSQMSGGIGILLGPTGGFLISFPIVAFIVGYFFELNESKLKLISGMFLGIIISYIIGTIQFCLITNTSFISGLIVCVLPFILVDLIKIILAYKIGLTLLKRGNVFIY